MAGDRTNDDRIASPRYRNVSGKPLNRRVVLKAAAGLGAVAATGGALTMSTPAVERVSAQEIDGVRGREWVADEQAGIASTTDRDGWVSFEAEFPFWAVGIGWDSAVGQWPVIELQVSYDGASWGETWPMVARVDDGGAETTVDKFFTDLLFTDGHQFIRYRTLDGEGNISPMPGLVITYIDPTDGPWEEDRATTMMRTSASLTNDDTDAPPAIITRAQWGANESLRYDDYGEIWPPEYETVEHAIVHHAAVNYPSGGYNAVRSIYYYHCVTQGWGDVGYNYLIDTEGRIFEGRVGGQNVIGGHSFEYAIGSSGICIMGDYSFQDATDASKAALVHILAFVTRDLDTYARKQFHTTPNLPTICAHRDVNQTSCPGDYLYDDLPEIRDLVAATLDANDLDTGNPAGIVPGDRVQVQTDDGNPLNLRSGPGGTNGSVLRTIPNGTYLTIQEGPRILADGNWYMTTYAGTQGWVVADYLIVTPLPSPLDPGDFAFGTNVRFTSSTNVRNAPSTSASVLGTATRNTWTFVMAGPVLENSYKWYQVRVAGIGDGWVIGGNLSPSPVVNATSHAFGYNQRVVTVRTASLRVRPGIAQTVSATIPSGTTLKVSVAPVSTTDTNWYGASHPTFGGGWIAEADLRAHPDHVFPNGSTVRVDDAWARLALRSAPDPGASLVAIIPRGVTGTVVSGYPRTGGGYLWLYIQTSYGRGWVVNYGMEKVPAVSTPSIPSDADVRVIEPVNMRTTFDTSAPIIRTLSVGTIAEVVSGYSRSGDGYAWSYIQVGSQRGWVVNIALAVVNQEPPPPPTGTFSIGQAVRVTEALNLRSGAGTGNGIIATLPAGTTGTVLEGPQTGSGYTWWRIQTSYGTGWAVEDWLTAASSSSGSTGAAFQAGDSFRVTEALNMRSGAGTGNSIVATLPAGTTGTITAASRSANGYTWWPVRTSAGSGWVVQNWIVKT